MRVLVLRRVLVHVDARQAGNRKWQPVCARLNLLVYLDLANVFQRFGERREAGNQIVASAQLEFLYWPLPFIENQITQMVWHFRLMLLHIRERAIQALLFAGEKDETNGAPRFH